MEPNGTHSEDTKARIARGVTRYHAVRRESGKILPSDLLAIARGEGGTKPALRPHVADSAAELADLASGLGGFERLSDQRRVLLEDMARLGLLIRALVVRYAATGDPDLASKIGTLANVRRASLVALGLERFERELDLHSYLASKAEKGGEA